MTSLPDPSEYRMLLGEPVHEFIALRLAREICASDLREWVREDLRGVEKSEEEIILGLKTEIEQNKIPSPVVESGFRPFLDEQSNNPVWAEQLAEMIKRVHLHWWLVLDLHGLEYDEDEEVLALKIQIEQNKIPDGDFKDELIRTWNIYSILNRQLAAQDCFLITRECEDIIVNEEEQDLEEDESTDKEEEDQIASGLNRLRIQAESSLKMYQEIAFSTKT